MNPPGVATGRRGGFTLIELLVVVAVVGVLIGLLLPALGRARVAARLVECASAVRLIAIINDLHAQDHDDRYMPAAAGIHGQNLERWHGRRRATGAPFELRGSALGKYLEAGSESGLRACPEFGAAMADLSERGRGFERGCGGYGYNAAFVGAERHEVAKGIWEVSSDRQGSRRSRFRGPAATVGFADAALAADEVIEYSFIEPAVWPQWPEFRPDPSTHFRHGGSASVAWLDGHVTSEERRHWESSGSYPLSPGDVGIGWFGETRDNRQYDYH